MRVAVLSDVHGNAVALDAVLADAGDVDRFVSLGDVAEGGPQPREAVDRLRELDAELVMGNCDEWLVDFVTEGVDEERVEAGRWTRDELGADRLALLAGFQPTVRVDSLLCFHGTPGSNEGILLPWVSEEEARAELDRDAAVQAGGHIHQQWTRRFGEVVFFNPGSVGMATASTSLPPAEQISLLDVAEYALVELADSRVSIELRRVHYDAGAVADLLRKSDMPHAEKRAAWWQSR